MGFWSKLLGVFGIKSKEEKEKEKNENLKKIKEQVKEKEVYKKDIPNNEGDLKQEESIEQELRN